MLRVAHGVSGYWLQGGGEAVGVANRFLEHLEARAFATATVRAYAFDLLSFLRFCEERDLGLGDVVATDVFDFLDWLGRARRSSGVVVAIGGGGRGAAPATMNRRIAGVRALFEYAVLSGACPLNPVPVSRRASGLRAKRRGMLGHISTGKPGGSGRLVRQANRLPESLDAEDVAAFIADLDTHRDRAMALAMVLGGLRAGEVRSLRLAGVDVGARRLRVLGKGGRERVVPVERAFFAELTAYLSSERPLSCMTPECFVVLRGPTRGSPLSEAGLRRVFRTHRLRSGTIRVRPPRRP